jgi:LacI family transcriptional regulator
MIRIGLMFTYNLHYCRGVLRGIKRYAEGRPKWTLLLLGPEREALAQLKAFRPHGVIAYVYNKTLHKALLRQRKPLVNVCGVLPNLGIPRVGVDNVSVGRLAAEHLLERGLRHFAFFGHARHAYSVDREAGFREALQKAGHEVACAYERGSASFDPMGHLGRLALDRQVTRWLASLPKPAGIFACSDPWGIQLAEVCLQSGLHVPEEVAIIGALNDDLLCEMARPPLSSVVAPTERVGYEAAALLDALLAGKKPSKAPLLFPPLGIVARQSSDILAIEDPVVAAAVRFIREHAHQPIQIRHVLAVVPLSRRSLERRFQAVLKRTLWEEIRRVHLERAKELLNNTGLPIAVVAEHAGFLSGKQLSVVFREETGTTPRAYRAGGS